MAYDLDGDGILELVYTTSSPGRMYVLGLARRQDPETVGLR